MRDRNVREDAVSFMWRFILRRAPLSLRAGQDNLLTYFTFLLVDFYMLGTAPRALCSHVYYLNVKITTLSNGYLGSRNDEERSEMRYVMRIAEFSESSNL